MNLKKKILMVSGILVLVVVVGVPTMLLFNGISRFSTAGDDLAMSVKALRGFYEKNPFPSRDNIKLERKNVEALEQWFEQLLIALSQGQIDEVQSTPSRFMTQYSQLRNDLVKRAGSALPEDFVFALGHYSEGALPAPADVPRLTQQLLIIAEIAETLIASNVKLILSVEREEFESGTAKSVERQESGRRRPGERPRPGPAPGGTPGPRGTPSASRDQRLFSKQHFSVEFKAKEAAVREVLNRLAAHEMFIVVTALEISKTAPDLKISGEPSGDEKADGTVAPVVTTDEEGRPLPRQQRLVSGPVLEMPLLVRVDFDVYTFKAGAVAQGEG